MAAPPGSLADAARLVTAGHGTLPGVTQSACGNAEALVLAGAIFKRVWKITAGEGDAPKATGAGRGWREVLLAALQGAIFALVKAAVDRAAAAGTHKLTGTWPGPGDQVAAVR